MRQSIKIPMLALETGHISRKAIAGGDILLSKMAPYLSSKLDLGVIVPIFAQNHWKNLPQVKVYRLPANPFDQYSNPILIFCVYLFRCFHSYKLLNNLHFDILYSSTDILTDILPAYFTKITHPEIRWIARVHHFITPPFEREGNLIVNSFTYVIQNIVLRLIKKADLVIALNSGLSRRLKQIGIKEKNLSVMGAGVDYEKISNFHSENIKYEAIYVGRLHASKGVYDLIKIWHQLIKILPMAKLAIVGEGTKSVLDKLKTEISKTGLTDNIFILGFLPENELLLTLKQSRIFLFTDHEAGFGLAVAEAMAAGLPVVGYDIGILGIVFQSGFLKVPLGNYHLFAQKIVLLLKNRKLYQQLTEQAKKEAAKLKWETVCNQFAMIIDRLTL